MYGKEEYPEVEEVVERYLDKLSSVPGGEGKAGDFRKGGGCALLKSTGSICSILELDLEDEVVEVVGKEMEVTGATGNGLVRSSICGGALVVDDVVVGTAELVSMLKGEWPLVAAYWEDESPPAAAAAAAATDTERSREAGVGVGAISGDLTDKLMAEWGRKERGADEVP